MKLTIFTVLVLAVFYWLNTGSTLSNQDHINLPQDQTAFSYNDATLIGKEVTK